MGCFCFVLVHGSRNIIGFWIKHLCDGPGDEEGCGVAENAESIGEGFFVAVSGFEQGFSVVARGLSWQDERRKRI